MDPAKSLPLLVSALMLLPMAAVASADRGMVIIDPPHVDLWESGQRAIVAWNGTDETLLLSTDVRTSEPAKILEVLAVPNNVTEVKEGSPASFTTLERLIVSKLPRPSYSFNGKEEQGAATAPSVEIQFHQQIGPHEVIVVKANDADYFKYWTRGFAFERGFTYSEISLGFVHAIQDYMDRGIHYFVFDVISTNDTVQSVSPLLYHFRSDSLYYPMQITSASNISDAYSSLSLFLLTDKGVADASAIRSAGLYPGDGFSTSIKLSGAELRQVEASLGAMLPEGAYAMQASFYGSFRSLTEDLSLGEGAFSSPGTTLPPYVPPSDARQPNYALAIVAIAALALFLLMMKPK